MNNGDLEAGPSTRRLWTLNALALAELILAEPVLRDKGPRWEALRAAFGDTLELVYAPLPDKPTLVDALDWLRARTQRYRSLDEVVAALPPTLRNALNPYRAQVLERVLPLFADVQAPGDAQGATSTAWPYREFGRLTATGRVSWRDPVQGNLADCGLIATLIATAWVDPARWDARFAAARQTATGDVYRLPFFAAGRPPQVPVQADFPFDPVGQNWIYARGDGGDEMWPALVEKAYAMWIAGIQWQPALPDADNLDPSQYRLAEHCYPHEAMRDLWGARALYRDGGFTLGRLVGTAGAYPLLDGRGAALMPLAAWTYGTAVETGDSGAYSLTKTGLVRNHAYALLGVATGNDGSTYVVLRNPHGDLGNAVAPAVRAKYLAGTWPTVDPRAGEVALNDNGVIAIPADWFERYFEGLSWLRW
jgi:hypothetical protein